MSLLRRLALVYLFAIFALPTAGVMAQTNFTTVVVFGDSLSDTGNIAHLTQQTYGIRYPSDNPVLGLNYTDGRFTDGTDTQPAASKAYTGVWVEQLAALFGTNVVVKNSLDGGTNYAYGDATTGAGTKTESRTAFGQTFSLTVNNMGQQVSDYLATNPKPNAQTLYVLWGGSNDILDAASAMADPVAAAQTAVQNELALIQQLQAAGATNFLVPTVPPLGAVAQGTGASAAAVAALNTASEVFAQGLTAGVNALKQASMGTTLNVYKPDVFTLFQAVAGNPLAFGFGDLTTVAQTVKVSPDTFLIWDGEHPTTTGHHYVAATAANLLSSLSQTSLSFSVPLAALAGETLTIPVTVTSDTGSHVPSGLVSLFESGKLVGSGALDASGITQITFTVTGPPGGNANLQLVYAGDIFNQTSLPAGYPLPLLSEAVSTTTSLSSSAASVNLGAAVTFTATVTPATYMYGGFDGSVTFFDGTTALGTVMSSGGTATYTTSSLSAGTHSITATYAATTLFGGSTSAALTETVTAPGFTVAASPSSLTVARGASGMVTFTVMPTGGYTGTVTPTCGTLPAHFSCTFAAPVANSTNGTTAYTLTVATNAPITTAAVDRMSRPGARVERVWAAGLLLPGMLGMMGFGLQRRKRGSLRLLSLGLGALFCAGMLGLSGCGDGMSNNAPSGSYTVPVVFSATSASGIAAQTVNVAVTVQ